MIRLRGAGCRFGAHEALGELDLTVHAGERVAVLGTSGAGKSTLLALVNGSLEPTTGSVEAFGENSAHLTAPRRRLVQRRIGSVSQDLALIEQVRVVHNVNAGRLGRWSTTRALASLIWPHSLDVVRDALERVDLGWGEPVSSLDPVRAARVLGLLGASPTGRTLVVSLHQPALAREHCTRVVGLRQGRIVLDLPAGDATDEALSYDLYELV